MPAFLIGLALKAGIPARFAKLAVIASLIVLLIVGIGVAKCEYDKSVIEDHEAKRDLAIEKANRKADAKAAEERRSDDARLADESHEIKETINEARAEGRDARAAYYACVRLQQSARASGRPPPDC